MIVNNKLMNNVNLLLTIVFVTGYQYGIRRPGGEPFSFDQTDLQQVIGTCPDPFEVEDVHSCVRMIGIRREESYYCCISEGKK